MSKRHIVPMGDVEIVNHARLPVWLVEYAREKITELARYTAQPILTARHGFGFRPFGPIPA